jgi:hypothetical protein
VSRYLGGANTLGAGFNFFAISDEERGGLWRAQDNYIWYRRNPEFPPGGGFFDLWPAAFGSTVDLCGIIGMDIVSMAAQASFETPRVGDGGKQAWYFIKGQVLNASAVPQTGVIVRGFRTSDNAYIGATTSDVNGNYMLPTPYSGVSHFIVAYEAGAPDIAGTTVNNLTPTAS